MPFNWMTLRHEAGQEGAGVVPWGATEKQRFASWRGGAPTAALQVIQLVTEHGNLTDADKEKVRDVPTSSFMRVLQTPDAAKALGVQYTRKTGELRTLYPEPEVAKGFTRLLRDLATGKVNSRAINKADDIRGYVARFKPSDLPSRTKSLPAPRPLTLSAQPGGSGTPSLPAEVRKGGPRNHPV